MENRVIETSIDELIRILKENEKMSISEVADCLKLSLRQIEPILNVLEENGTIEIKYPVIGEPKIILKPNAPTKIEIKKAEIVKKIENENKIEPEIIERTDTSERMEAKPEIVRNEETRAINEKVEKLESEITELSNKLNASTLKEDLSEILLIVAGLRETEKISFYLKEVLSLIHKMKEKKIWTNEDEVFVTTMLKAIAENWRVYNEENKAKVFDDVRGKIETA